MTTAPTKAPARIVSREQWKQARKALLEREKAHTQERDELARLRQALPWVRIDTPYEFDTPSGKATLAHLFDGRSQLLVYHFMFGPGWGEGCVGCSFLADHIDSANQHLRQHDVTLVACSRAPLPELEAFQRRMGWRFPWVSSFNSTFNYDFYASYTPEQIAAGKVEYNFEMRDMPMEEVSGLSAFARGDRGEVYHTYSTFARGCEGLIGTYDYLDMAPSGRNEPEGRGLTAWVRHHDRYGAPGHVDATGRFRPAGCCKGHP